MMHFVQTANQRVLLPDVEVLCRVVTWDTDGAEAYACEELQAFLVQYFIFRDNPPGRRIEPAFAKEGNSRWSRH